MTVRAKNFMLNAIVWTLILATPVTFFLGDVTGQALHPIVGPVIGV
jgi:hypothetical protein